MKLQTIIITTLLILTLFSCDSDSCESVEISLPLTDCWLEFEPESFIQFAGSNHTFCFLSDTEFTLQLDSWTDAIVAGGSGQWTEYIRGTYVLTSDAFEVTGKYTESDFVTLVTNSIGETDFANTYALKVVSETELVLDNNVERPTQAIRLMN